MVQFIELKTTNMFNYLLVDSTMQMEQRCIKEYIVYSHSNESNCP